jgi:uncharacterized NAD(P)/FAD-binding protein YdhS
MESHDRGLTLRYAEPETLALFRWRTTRGRRPVTGELWRIDSTPSLAVLGVGMAAIILPVALQRLTGRTGVLLFCSRGITSQPDAHRLVRSEQLDDALSELARRRAQSLCLVREALEAREGKRRSVTAAVDEL